MVQRKEIAAFVARIAKRFRPQRVVLFGSYAYGKPSADSDVDLLVVMDYKGHAAVQAAEIRKQIRAGFPLDLVVRSPRAVAARRKENDCFLAEVLDRGETLYEVDDATVD
jgi:predicted nucleotidyltransferase